MKLGHTHPSQYGVLHKQAGLNAAQSRMSIRNDVVFAAGKARDPEVTQFSQNLLQAHIFPRADVEPFEFMYKRDNDLWKCRIAAFNVIPKSDHQGLPIPTGTYYLFLESKPGRTPAEKTRVRFQFVHFGPDYEAQPLRSSADLQRVVKGFNEYETEQEFRKTRDFINLAFVLPRGLSFQPILLWHNLGVYTDISGTSVEPAEALLKKSCFKQAYLAPLPN